MSKKQSQKNSNILKAISPISSEDEKRDKLPPKNVSFLQKLEGSTDDCITKIIDPLVLFGHIKPHDGHLGSGLDLYSTSKLPDTSKVEKDPIHQITRQTSFVLPKPVLQSSAELDENLDVISKEDLDMEDLFSQFEQDLKPTLFYKPNNRK